MKILLKSVLKNSRFTKILTSITGTLHEELSTFMLHLYEGWNFNSGNYLFTTDTK